MIQTGQTERTHVMPDTKLLKKYDRLLALSNGALLGIFTNFGMLLLTQMIVGVTYDKSWMFGVYLCIAIFVINLVLFLYAYIRSMLSGRSEAYCTLERMAREKAAGADIGSGETDAGTKAAMAGGIAVSAAGRAAAHSKNEKVSAAGDAATAIGAAAVTAAVLSDSGKKRTHVQAMQQVLNGEQKKDHTFRNILLIETLIVAIAFIPGFISVRAEYHQTADVMQTTCDGITDALEESGVFDEVRSSLYKSVYADVYAYLDEAHDSYLNIDVESDGSISGLTYRINTAGAQTIEDAAETANEAVAQIYAALEGTAVSDTDLYVLFVIDDAVLAVVSDGGYYKYTDDNGIEITCNYDNDDGGDDPHFYVWAEAD